MMTSRPLVWELNLRLARERRHMGMRRGMLTLLMIGGFAVLAAQAGAQSRASAGDSPSAAVGPVNAPLPQTELAYTRPTEKTKLHNYFFDAFGPYPLVGAAFVAGINQ